MYSKCPPPARTHDLRRSRHWSVVASDSDSDHDVLVKVKPSLIQSFSQVCFHTYIRNKIITLVHFDEAVMHLMLFSLAVFRCNIIFSAFWLSQGSVATLIRQGGWSSYCRWNSLIFGRPLVKRFALCYPTVVVRNVSVLLPNGWMDQDVTWYGGRPRTKPHCVRCEPSSPTRKGHSSPQLFGTLLSGTVAHLSNCWAVVDEVTGKK